MDIFSFLGYLNKLSLVAFVVTLAVLLYQLYLLRKEASAKKDNPVIPEFDENKTVIAPALNYTKLDTSKLVTKKKTDNNLILLISITLVVMIILFGTIISKNNNNTSAKTNTPLIQFVASKGIKIYDTKWSELNSDQIIALKTGDHVFIGLDKPNDVNIDGARMRVNQDKWLATDENLQFSNLRNVYYEDYVIATGAAFLKIEAQLHSKVDGWLGE